MNLRCCCCKLKKHSDCFHKTKSTRSGFHKYCKECRAAKQKNNPKDAERKHKWYLRNKKRMNIASKKWAEKNPEKRKNIALKYSRKNRLIINEKGRLRYLTPEGKEKAYAHVLNHRMKNPHIYAWRRILSNYFRRFGGKKESKTIELLGYSALQLKQSIESKFTEGMSWGNHGDWHIDHIKPICSFDKSTPAFIVNSLDNLQPLWATTRVINGKTYIGNLNKNRFSCISQ